MPSAFSVKVPWAGPVTSTAESVSFSASVSLASKLLAPPVSVVAVPPSETLMLSATATGVSLTAVTVTVLVAAVLLSVPSLTTTLMVRLVVSGVSELLLYVTARRAASHWASVAVAPAEVSDNTPVPLL